MAIEYSVRFLLSDEMEDLTFKVQEEHWGRLQDVLNNGLEITQPRKFFAFRTGDGRAVAISLRDVLAMRFLSYDTDLPSDPTISNGPILIRLRGRRQPLEVVSSALDKLADLVMFLEINPDDVPYPALRDKHDQVLRLSTSQIVWITAPSHLVDEGYRIVAIEDGLLDD